MASAGYHKFMRSQAWRAIRLNRIQQSRHQCDRCGSPVSLEVHHKTYERFGGNELMTDLECLCQSCHDKQHGRRRSGAKPARRKSQPMLVKPSRAKRAERIARGLALSATTYPSSLSGPVG